MAKVHERLESNLRIVKIMSNILLSFVVTTGHVIIRPRKSEAEADDFSHQKIIY